MLPWRKVKATYVVRRLAGGAAVRISRAADRLNRSQSIDIKVARGQNRDWCDSYRGDSVAKPK